MKKKISFIIDKDLDGRRIESILKNRMEMSKTLIGRLKREKGSVLLGGKDVRLTDRAYEGDLLEINIPHRKKIELKKWDFPINILFEDDDVLIVNKPCSMPTHPSKNHPDDTLANAVAYYLGESSAFHPITRLDKDTSGAVIIAKNVHSAKKLTSQIKERTVKKEYVAIVNGVLSPPCGTLSFPIGRGLGIKRCVTHDGKEAVTKYETEKAGEKFSFLRLFPITGRTHQLRVHLSYIGHPIYGDSMYGAPQKNKRTLLHCRKVTFNHPINGREITVEAPIPDDIKKEM